MKEIPSKIWQEAYTYEAYKNLIDVLLSKGITTGTNQSEAMTQYALMGRKRMKKWDKIARLDEKLQAQIKALAHPINLLVITEGWCGDAAQIIPFLHKMVEANPQKLAMKLVLRDENLDLMDQFLTNGARSIPKVIAFDPKDRTILGDWGPRPLPIQTEFLENKKTGAKTGGAFAEYMHLWYAKDKGQTIQQEFEEVLYAWQEALVGQS